MGDSNQPPQKVDVGLTDLCVTGWFQGSSLYPGFDVKAEDVVLDVGCGNGGVAAFCARQGAHVIFSDVLSQKVARTHALLQDAGARELTPIVATSERIPLPDATATRVICTDVLEHVPDPKLLMAELVRVAKPGALFTLTVPDAVSESLQKRVAPPTEFMPPNHVRVFSFDAFHALVRGAGLDIKRHDREGFYSTIFLALFWVCKFPDRDVGLVTRDHPLLDAWAQTWHTLLGMQGGRELKAELDRFLPSRQVIVARKPKRRGLLERVLRKLRGR